MANPKIEVEIGAVTDKLIKGVDGSILSLEKLEKEIDQLGKQLKTEIDPTQIGVLNQRLNQLTSGAKNLKNIGIDPLTRATSSYNGVGIEFSRIIQDAPYGIIGVGNNITRLAETFTQAKNSGQSFGQIMGGILTGGNALILGISLLTTAFTVLSQKGFFDTKKKAEDSQKALEDYRKSLDELRRSSLEGEIAAQKEIQNFQLLKAQAENANVPLNKRLEAVRDLKKEFPEYLKSLTNEQILTGNVAGAYDRLTTSLLESAKARAASNIIIKNTEEVLTLQQQQLDNEQAIINARDKVARLEASANNSAVNALKINGQITAQNTELVRAKEELNDLLIPQIERGNRVNELTTQNIRLNNDINTSLENGANLTKTITNETDKTKNKVVLIDKAWQENEKTLLRIIELSSKISTSLPDLVTIPKTAPVKETADTAPLGQIQSLEKQIELITKLRNAQTDTGAIQGYNQQLIGLQTQLKNLTSAGQEVISSNDILTSSFSALGNQIAASLNIGNNALEGFISTLLSSTPKIIQAIFKQVAAKKAADALIVASNAQVAASEGIAVAAKGANALGPVGLALLPVFIGGALAIIGGAFSSIGGKSKGTSGVGGGSSGTNFTANTQGTTGFNRDLVLKTDFDMGKLVFYIEQSKESNI